MCWAIWWWNLICSKYMETWRWICSKIYTSSGSCTLSGRTLLNVLWDFQIFFLSSDSIPNYSVKVDFHEWTSLSHISLFKPTPRETKLVFNLELQDFWFSYLLDRRDIFSLIWMKGDLLASIELLLHEHIDSRASLEFLGRWCHLKFDQEIAMVPSRDSKKELYQDEVSSFSDVE